MYINTSTVFFVLMSYDYIVQYTLIFEFSCNINHYSQRLQLTSVPVTSHHDAARLKVLVKIVIDSGIKKGHYSLV